jgi:hypothetical protein
MKMKKLIVLSFVVVGMACNETKSDVTLSDGSKTKAAPLENTSSTKVYVSAKINGVAWESVPSEILAKYYEIDDKLNIYTVDTKNEMNFLLTCSPYSKTQVGSYNSVKEGAGGYGITLNDNNTKDDIPKDYDNYHQGATPNCLTITTIKEVKSGKLIAGTFASPMNVSNNYDANKNKGIVVTEGKFQVLLEN